MYFCECLNGNNLHDTPIHETIKLASIDDVDRIMQLRSSITEFRTAHESEKFYDNLLKQIQDVHIILKRRWNHRIRSTSAENSLSAMVVGVCTHPNYRGNGFASLLLQK